MAGAFLSWQTTVPAMPDTVVAGRETHRLPSAELETLYLVRRPEMIRFLIRYGVDII